MDDRCGQTREELDFCTWGHAVHDLPPHCMHLPNCRNGDRCWYNHLARPSELCRVVPLPTGGASGGGGGARAAADGERASAGGAEVSSSEEDDDDDVMVVLHQPEEDDDEGEEQEYAG